MHESLEAISSSLTFFIWYSKALIALSMIPQKQLAYAARAILSPSLPKLGQGNFHF